MIAGVQEWSLSSWRDHLPFGNPKRFWRDLRFSEIALVLVSLDHVA
jgi:hypothetical protein